jgi:glycerophosphoryl diester phosphodiesterase
MFPVVLLFGSAILYLVYRTRRVHIPHTQWKRYHRKGTKPIEALTCNDLQGIYIIEEGKSFLGKQAVLKWTYTVERKRTVYHLSFFCEKGGTFIVCEGRYDDKALLLNGYWRNPDAGETGTVHLQVGTDHFGAPRHPLIITGVYGMKEKQPTQPLSLQYQGRIPEKKPLHIIAHRGGARNVDFLSVSENSLEMFKMAARLGATGVEIDIRLTKDNVPIVVHDSFLSLHNFQDTFYGGLVSNYTLAELKRKVLKKGGIVPTLNEALQTILYHTPLNLVWLDIKKECDLTGIRKLQLTYLQKAKELGRDLEIYIGIPDKDVLGCFCKLPDFLQLPSLTELDTPVAQQIDANVWAPQYTGGFQKDEVRQMQASGKKVFVWSLDHPLMISLYLKEGGFDGIVTNAAPTAFYTYYTSLEMRAGN